MEISEKSGLIVGGGVVAVRKIEKLLPYGPQLTVAAPAMIPEILAIVGIEGFTARFHQICWKIVFL